MKILNWFQKRYWNDGGFRGMFYFFTVGPILGTFAISIVDHKFNPVALLGWAFYFFIVLPIAYLMRNNP